MPMTMTVRELDSEEGQGETEHEGQHHPLARKRKGSDRERTRGGGKKQKPVMDSRTETFGREAKRGTCCTQITWNEDQTEASGLRNLGTSGDQSHDSFNGK